MHLSTSAARAVSNVLFSITSPSGEASIEAVFRNSLPAGVESEFLKAVVGVAARVALVETSNEGCFRPCFGANPGLKPGSNQFRTRNNTKSLQGVASDENKFKTNNKNKNVFHTQQEKAT